MTETFRCGDESALVAFLYDECEPGEREAIAAHVVGCLRCTSELDSLAATRHQLSLWTPPEGRLGFRITSDDVNTVVDARSAFGAEGGPSTPGSVPRAPATWWRQPLPAWGQAAAAALIFAAGLAVGTVRTEEGAAPAVQMTSDASALRQIAALERRVASMEQSSQARLATAASALPEVAGRADDLVRWVRREIEASELRQSTDLTRMARQMAWEQDEQLGGFEERVDQRVALAVDREVKPLYQVLSANTR